VQHSSGLIYPDWPAPDWVHAISTTRQGGVSAGPFSSFNLAQHVGDNAENVRLNRAHLAGRICLPQEPAWLTQVHGERVVDIAQVDRSSAIEADASYSLAPGQVCAVMTADCLPLLLCHSQRKIVAVVHAGWRGLAQGVIEATLSHFADDRQHVLAWLGPAISSKAFEVGEDVYQALALDKESLACFIKMGNDRWHADLFQLARLRLYKAGVTAIYGGEVCTYTDFERFFSFRREGETGRMANLIWMTG